MSKLPGRSFAKNASGDGTPPSDHETGLPGLRSWRVVYVFVFGIFLLWLGLLTWLTEYYTA
jgi:hypothetical protein